MSDDTRTGMNPALKIILIVAGVLCLLACGAITVFGLLVKKGVDEFHDLAQTELTKATIQQTESAIDRYRLMHGELPPNLDAIVGPDGMLDSDTPPTDAWGAELDYAPSADGEDYTLRSLGADGAEGGEDENADITRESVRRR